MLAREYICKAKSSCLRAIDNIDKDEEYITVEDILRSLGDLDFVEDRIKATKILLRLKLKELRGENVDEIKNEN